MRNVLGLFLPDELKGEERLAELLCKKVLQHAIDHLADGGDFDRRIAMISVDNAVELMVKTFLGLRRRASGDAGPTRRELEACEAFPALLDILEKYAGGSFHSRPHRAKVWYRGKLHAAVRKGACQPMKRIVNLAMNPSIDKSSSVEHVIAERKLYCKPPRFEPGGGGVNVSRALKKLGGESTLLYASGGLTGHRLNDLMDEEGITCRPLPIEGMIRESLVILEESTGRQFRFGMPGPKLLKREWEQFLDELSAFTPPADYLVASGSLPTGVPDDFYAEVARIGRDRGARVIIDASGEALKQALQVGVYLIKPNIREFGDMVGENIREEPQIREEALKIVRSGTCEIIVVSLGAGGALMVSENATEHILPPTVPIISKVGAGDSMVAGMVLSLARDNNPRNAVLFGVAAGTAAVMTPGTELCRREDVERLYAQML